MIGILNQAHTAVLSSINGVLNTINVSTQANISGYMNTITGGSQNSILGSNNTLTNGTQNFIAGFGNTLGANLSNAQVLGSGVTIAAGLSNAVALGSGTGVTTNGGVALGSGSQATIAAGVAGYNPATGAAYTGAASNVWTSTLGAVSVGNGSTATRQITGLAAGTQLTDAVNVQQLMAAQAAATTHYFSVKSTDVSATSNYLNDGATGTNSLAAGVGASATQTGSTALGNSSLASGAGAVAVGDATGSGGNSVAIGTGTTASGANSIAIGSQRIAGQLTTAAGKQAIAMGFYASANGDNSFAVGAYATAATNAISIGEQSHADQIASIAIGSRANAGVEAIQLGSSSVTANSNHIGAFRRGSTLIGYEAASQGLYSTIIGNQSQLLADQNNKVGGFFGFGTFTAQGAFSNILGAYNTIGTKTGGNSYDNVAVSVVGAANNVQGSNGVFVNGYGNSVTNSYNGQIDVSGMTDSTASSISALLNNPNTQLGQVGVMGAVNNVDHANNVYVVGMRNTIASTSTTANAVTNSMSQVTGFNQMATDITRVFATGSANTLFNVSDVFTAGSNSTLTNVSNSIAMGNNQVIGSSTTTAANAILLGNNIQYGNTASASNSVAIGDNTRVVTGAVAVGVGAQATGLNSIAIGRNAIATGSVATGSAALAGNGGSAYGDGAVATYMGGTIDPAVVAGTALGQNASADVSGGTAVGTGARVTIADGVALGTKAVANTAAGIAGYAPSGISAAQALAITNTTGTLAAVSVGDAANNQFRQITGVAAGTANSDAVNVAQLAAAQAAATTHFYSVNGTPADANYNNDGATGTNALAAGVGALAQSSGATAVGYRSTVNGAVSANSTAVGSVNTITNSAANQVFGAANTVVANIAAAQSGQNVTSGNGNTLTNSTGTLVYGNGNTVTATSTPVKDGVIIGSGNQILQTATGSPNAVALIGGLNVADGASLSTSVTGIGNQAHTAVLSSINGVLNTINGASQANISGVSNTITGGSQNSVLGSNNTLTNSTQNFIAGFGNTLGANLSNAQIIGSGVTVAAGAANVVAIGSSSTVGANMTVALGGGANAGQAGAVALGAGSQTAAAIATPSTTIAGTTYNFAGITPQSTVSIGVAGGERTLTNLAAGQISATSTDAINGSQLYGTNLAVEDAILQARGNTTALGGGAAYDPLTNTYTAPTYTTTTGSYSNVGAALTAANNQTNMLGSTAATGIGGGSSYNPATGALTVSMLLGGTTYTNVYDALKAVNTTAGLGWNVIAGATGTGVVNGAASTNIAPGGTHSITAGDNIIATQTGTDVALAVNPNLKVDTVTATTVTTGNTTMNTNGVTIVGGPNNTVALTSSGLDNGGNRITNVMAGSAQTDAVNVSQLQQAVNNVSLNFGGNVGAPVTASNGQTVMIQGAATTAGPYSGGNIRTTADASTGAINIEMSERPTFGNVTVNADGSGKITGVTAATLSSTSTEAVNGSQLVALGDSIAAGLSPGSTYNHTTGTINTQIAVGGTIYTTVESAIQAVSSAAGGHQMTASATGSGVVIGSSVAAVAPGATVQYTAGNNVIMTQNGTNIQVAVNPNLTGIESIQVANGPTINGNGIDMHGDRITNVGNGVAPTDAVNLGQLNAGLANTLVQANTYTDQAIADVRFDLSNYRRDANGGTASAMAMAQVPQAFEPGMGIAGMGVSTWQGEQAIAMGFSKASDDGRLVVRASGTYNTRRQAGAAVGFGIQF